MAAGGGWTVVSQGPEGLLTCRTDRLGRFAFEGLDPGDHVVWVRDLDERGVVVPVGDSGSAAVSFAAPAEARSLAGHVLDADQAPLPGVEVEAAGRRSRTDADGRFEIAGIPPGPERIQVSFVPGTGCRALVTDPHLPHVERKAVVGSDLRILLQRSGRLRLRFEPGERRLARARVHVASAGELRVQRQVVRGAEEMVVDDLPLGPCVVDVAAPGLLGTGGAIVEAQREPGISTLALRKGRSLRGAVLLRRTLPRPGQPPLVVDAPVERGWVTLVDGDPLRALATTPIAADGSFLLEGLPEGPLVLAASAPCIPVALVRADAGAEDLRIHLEPAGEAAIRVGAPDGTPLPDARVRVVTEHGVDVRDLAARGRFLQVVASDVDAFEVERYFRLVRTSAGRIAAPFLQPGSYRFLVSADGYKEARIGVRARDEASLHAVRELPGLPDDWASPVRLEPAPPGGQEED